MIRFENDYHEGALPQVMELLMQTNLDQTCGYGQDEWCDKARAVIRKLCGAPDADVHFLVGGTQANCTVIDSLLMPYEGVIAATTGHIAVHETGGVEASGHKVITVPEKDGKLTAAQVEQTFLKDGNSEHVVRPGMVYISFPTEYGTLYTKKELEDIRAVCRRYGLKLFIDGARLAYGLEASSCDLTIRDLAKLCDVFYIGGTKVGALFGEAVVFTDPSLSAHFRYSIKQHGGMLAKGRLLGIQFYGLLKDGAYFEAGKHAVGLAEKIREALDEKGIERVYPNDTNQIFCVLTGEQYAALTAGFIFNVDAELEDGKKRIRICTSWATPEENVDSLVAAIRAL